MKRERSEFDSNYLTDIEFSLQRPLAPAEIAQVSEQTEALPGIEEMVFFPDLLKISYYSHLVTGDYIKETLLTAGVPMVREQRQKKSSLQRFLERIAESNEKAKQDQGPACCRIR